MKIINKYGKDDLAILYIAEIDNKIIEFVESVQPPIPRDEKWVLIISTLYGCPINCLICDAGVYYNGKVSKTGMLKQIDYMVYSRFNDGIVPVNKFKIQFARMGEPTLNMEVLDVLVEISNRYNAPGLIPCISTIAPRQGNMFLDKLLTIKDKLYSNGHFQLQFSVHSTTEASRQKWMTPKIWNLNEISNYGEKWYKNGDRKITLNFAVSKDNIIDPDIVLNYFDPNKFFIKLTPINPTNTASENNVQTGITKDNYKSFPLVQEFINEGFEVLLSIGEWEENKIGTNCGQFATKYTNGQVTLKDKYETSNYLL